MMYKLQFQKCGPYAWGDVHVVVGDIGAVHSLYNALLVAAGSGSLDWNRRLVAEVTAVSSTGGFDKIFQIGTFKSPGASSVDDNLGEQ